MAACELVSIPTEDGLLLDGLLRRGPDGGGTDQVVLYLHGKGGSFCAGPGRFVPESAAMQTVTCDHLAINMRMHHLGFSRHNGPGIPPLTNCPPQQVSVGGGMWECLTEGIRDVAAAVGWLRSTLGYSTVFVVGKSSGGYYATHYASEIGSIAGVMLLSPVHSHRMPFPTWFSSADEERKLVSQARQLVAEGRGYMLLPLPEWYFGISAASLVERADEPSGIWHAWMEKIDVPVLSVYGSAEVPDTEIWKAGFDACPSKTRQLLVVPGADHSYRGSEDIVSQGIVEFIKLVKS